MSKLTGALEDYLETIYLLQRDRPYARVKDIARERKVKPGSVSPAIKRLATMGLVEYHQREYICLTDEGEAEGRRVYSRHRILTAFFEKVLKMSPVSADRDACALEHSISDEAMDRLVRFFEYLAVCPSASTEFVDRFHNCSRVNPETGGCGEDCAASRVDLASESMTRLNRLKPGERGIVRQVRAHGAVRQRLLDMGLLPDTVVELVRKAPSGDPIWIRFQHTQLALRADEARTVLVEPVEA